MSRAQKKGRTKKGLGWDGEEITEYAREEAALIERERRYSLWVVFWGTVPMVSKG